MKIDHSVLVLDYKGKPITDEGSEARPLTFYDLVMTALNMPDPNMPPSEKAQVFAVAVKLQSGPIVEISVEEAALIKSMAGKSVTPLGFGRICEWIEASAEPDAAVREVGDQTPDA